MPAPHPIVAAALVAAAVTLAGCGRTGPAVSVEADDMSLGNPAAKVRVVEYASASCPHCARFALDVFPAFKAKYVDTGGQLTRPARAPIA